MWGAGGAKWGEGVNDLNPQASNDALELVGESQTLVLAQGREKRTVAKS